jgi:hypothetical protein
MYVSQQMLRVHHDEWMRYAESRRSVSQATTERRVASRRVLARQSRLRLRLSRPVRHV